MIDYHNLFTHASLFYLNHIYIYIFCHSVCGTCGLTCIIQNQIEEIFKYSREWEVLLIKSYRNCLSNVFGTNIFFVRGFVNHPIKNYTIKINCYEMVRMLHNML